jgi:hypothetical protein
VGSISFWCVDLVDCVLKIQAFVLFRVGLVGLVRAGVWDFMWDFLAVVASSEKFHRLLELIVVPLTVGPEGASMDCLYSLGVGHVMLGQPAQTIA